MPLRSRHEHDRIELQCPAGSEAGATCLSPEVSGPRRSSSLPDRTELDRILLIKFGDPETWGWGPLLRHRFGYFSPDEVYEGVLAKLVTAESAWLDVGCGRELLPSNPRLALLLADRCSVLVGLDPSDNLEDNPHVHERSKCMIDRFESARKFDLVTLRMVAEHLEDPGSALAALARVTKQGAKVVVYTVNRWTPLAIAAAIIPFRLHHMVKRFLWRTEERDTFPTAYRMNTRRALARLFQAYGFREVDFDILDDCSTFGRFRVLHTLELSIRRCFRSVGLHYPENCLIGIYERLGP